jgi:hypothetical protein
MADFSKLSREELIQMLRINKEDFKKDPIEENHIISQCKYKPIRSNQNPCLEPISNQWGYCKKHSKTVQARNAERLYQEEIDVLQFAKKQELEEIEPVVIKQPLFEEKQSIIVESSDNSKKINEKTHIKKSSHTKIPSDVNLSKKINEKTHIKKSSHTKIPSDVNLSKKHKNVKEKKSSLTSENPPKLTNTNIDKTSSKKIETIEQYPSSKKSTIRTKIIRRNYWGRFEDVETHIVFDPLTQFAYGVQDPSGAVYALTESHIKICKTNGWNYNPCDDDCEVSSSDESSDNNTDTESLKTTKSDSEVEEESEVESEVESESEGEGEESEADAEESEADADESEEDADESEVEESEMEDSDDEESEMEASDDEEDY